MNDSVEGPSATIKQKIEDRGSLRKWSGVAIIVYNLYRAHSRQS